MIRLYLILAFIVVPVLTKAQTIQKKIIGIASVEYTNEDYKAPAAQLQDLVIQAFAENKNIELLDRSKVLQIEKELNIQKGKSYVNGKTVPQNRSHGAELLIIGNLANITIEANKYSLQPGQSGLSKMTVFFSLQAVNVTTGEVTHQESFAADNVLTISSDNKQNIQNSITTGRVAILTKIEDWVNSVFPPKFKIISVDETNKKGDPKTITIVIDRKLNLKLNYIININEVSVLNIDGENKTKIDKIASISVKELQGDFFRCTVLEGAEVLGAKWKDKESNLQLELTTKKTSLRDKLKL